MVEKRKPTSRALVRQREDIECAGDLVDGDDRHEHQNASDECIEEKLDGGIDAALMAENPDEEVHRDQHGLPEEIEEHQVERAEDPYHTGLEEEQKHHELFQSDLCIERIQHAEKHQECR